MTRLTDEQWPNTTTRLRGRWLLLARISWLLTAFLIVMVFLAGITALYDQRQQVCLAATEVCERFALLTPEGKQNLERVGLSITFYAVYETLLISVYYAVSWIIAALIFWRRSDDWMALLVALMLVSFGDSSPLEAARSLHPALVVPARFIQLLNGLLLALFYIFPDGRFVPSWTRWGAILWLLFGSMSTFFPDTALDPETWSPWLFVPLWMCLLLSFVVAQVIRYRYVSNSVQRQQTKWIVFGFAVSIIGFLVLVIVTDTVPMLAETGTLLNLGFRAVYFLVILLVPLSFGMAILRSRLYDIDVIINRTLVYGTLTGLLAVIYIGSIVILQVLLRPLVGIGSNAATVASTLAIAVLFQPLRRRIQAIIDRRFYRQKYDAQKMLATFSSRLRDETDIQVMTKNLLSMVQETLQPTHVSLWLRDRPRGMQDRELP